MELSDFLIKAKLGTYASDRAQENILEDGSRNFRFEIGDFVYQDRYYGFDPFFGQEIVRYSGMIVWSMNYFGKTSSTAVSAKDIYVFLKKALRQPESGLPLRGPKNLKDGDFEYINETIGDIFRFIGTEKILFCGLEVYRLDYHGGDF